MTKLLIVNADDLGLSAGVNRGIVETHTRGIVTSTTVMVNLPDAAAGVRLVLAEAPALGLGLHVNLTSGRPVLPAARVPSLVGADGRFMGVSRGLLSPRGWRPQDIEAEVAAQFERFVALADRLPDHLDTHQMVDTLSPGCSRAMLTLAARHKLPLRMGGGAMVRRLEQEVTQRPFGRYVAPTLFKLWPRLLGTHDEQPPPLHPDFFEIGFFRASATVATLLAILDRLPEGVTEIVTHPGYLAGGGDAYRSREVELAALTNPAVKERVEANKIRLVTFAQLA